MAGVWAFPSLSPPCSGERNAGQFSHRRRRTGRVVKLFYCKLAPLAPVSLRRWCGLSSSHGAGSTARPPRTDHRIVRHVSTDNPLGNSVLPSTECLPARSAMHKCKRGSSELCPWGAVASSCVAQVGPGQTRTDTASAVCAVCMLGVLHPVGLTIPRPPILTLIPCRRRHEHEGPAVENCLLAGPWRAALVLSKQPAVGVCVWSAARV